MLEISLFTISKIKSISLQVTYVECPLYVYWYIWSFEKQVIFFFFLFFKCFDKCLLTEKYILNSLKVSFVKVNKKYKLEIQKRILIIRRMFAYMLFLRVEQAIGSDQIINIVHLHFTAVEWDMFNYWSDW